jgi:hypothetical protein
MGALMRERVFIAPDRRIWLVRVRPEVRHDEAETHVTLELMCDEETRVVSCRREAWEVAAPDFAALLAESVASGASRNVTPPHGTPVFRPD